MPLPQWLDEAWDDVTFGLRQLAGAPAFTLVAVVTLALGIGANAAVFGVLKSVLLDALPFADADRLVLISGGLRGQPVRNGPVSAGTVREIGLRGRSFASLAAFGGLVTDVTLGGDEGPRIARSAWVEPRFFDTLGVLPALGRTFQADDATSGMVPLSGGQAAEDTARSVVLTDAAWRRLFAADPAVVGRDVRVNGIARTVIGVLPPGFVGPMGEADLYFAFDPAPVLANPITIRRSQWLRAVARVEPGVGVDAARDEVAAIWAALVREFPDDNGSLAITSVPLRDAMAGDTRTPLLVLMASAGLVLLIACGNLAAALLSRALARRKEFAVRIAMGAGHRRLVRQLLTESTLLALIGGTAGLVLAAYGLSLADRVALPGLPEHAALSLDRDAVLITAALAVLTGIAFGLVPALSAARPHPQTVLRDEARGMSEGRRPQRLRGALVAGQLALCISLLTGAGLLARSLWAMTTAPLGFEPDGVFTAAAQLPARAYPTPEARARFHEQFVERLRGMPGVTAVAVATSLPTAVRQRAGVTVDRAPMTGSSQPFVLLTAVSDDYFRVLEIPLRQGRLFGRDERLEGPPAVLINESMAARFWPQGGALGARIRLGPDPSSPLIEVVGIVGDVRNDRLRADAEPMVYASTRQNPAPILRVVLRTMTDPMTLARPVEQALSSLDANLPLQQPMMLSTILGRGLATRRVPVVLIAGFGVLALLLAVVGVYAMFASMTAAREREFGVRIALGSPRAAIAALVLRQGAGWMVAGLAGGALGVLVVVRLVADLLYGVSAFDPLTLGTVVGVLAGCATLALLIPLRRATRVNPASALRAQ